MFDIRSMMKAAGVDVAEMENRFKMLHETVQEGYIAFVDVQAQVRALAESNARIEQALAVLLKDRNDAEAAFKVRADALYEMTAKTAPAHDAVHMIASGASAQTGDEENVSVS